MRIGVVGLGYVGLPLAVAFCEAGHEVVGVDTDARVVEALSAGHSHVEDVPDEPLRAVAERLHPSTRYAALAKVDAIVVAVPTPLTRNREPDLQPLLEESGLAAGRDFFAAFSPERVDPGRTDFTLRTTPDLAVHADRVHRVGG
jgi:UDP-N-acetyl-D-glucosamine dehydrogenase